MHYPETSRSTTAPRAERGRAAVPVEQALAFQVALIEHMVGARWQELTDEEKDEVMMEWLSKYADNDPVSTAGFNAFGEYCDTHADDQAFIERMKSGQWTEADLDALKHYAEESPKGSPFMTVH